MTNPSSEWSGTKFDSSQRNTPVIVAAMKPPEQQGLASHSDAFIHLFGSDGVAVDVVNGKCGDAGFCQNIFEGLCLATESNNSLRCGAPERTFPLLLINTSQLFYDVDHHP